ncbi:flagellar protein FlaG [Heyndrickxia ginsengihumi]|uniref:flagellar protein FlaG n=1 Tax=Heyndrickxia ginsengihumi TaxID=363870 RepID=UPI003D21AFEB
MIDRIAGVQMPTTMNLSNLVQGETDHIQTSESSRHYQEANENLSKEKMQDQVDEMNSLVFASNTHLQFELYEKLNEYYVKIIDNKTNEVIKEIPSKKMLDVYAAMKDFLGLKLDKKI